MNSDQFDEVFNKVVVYNNIPKAHIYSLEAIRSICMEVCLKLEEEDQKNAEAGMVRMGYTPIEIEEDNQFQNCSRCPDYVGCHAKFTKETTIEERNKFLNSYSHGCQSKWDLHHVGEGIGDWEGIYRGEPQPLFGNNIRELILAFKLWWWARKEEK